MGGEGEGGREGEVCVCVGGGMNGKKKMICEKRILLELLENRPLIYSLNTQRTGRS